MIMTIRAAGPGRRLVAKLQQQQQHAGVLVTLDAFKGSRVEPTGCIRPAPNESNDGGRIIIVRYSTAKQGQPLISDAVRFCTGVVRLPTLPLAPPRSFGHSLVL
jgi:hypothetical protein